mgnify:CR=1 FL=1
MPRKALCLTEVWGDDVLDMLKKIPRVVDGIRYNYVYVKDVLKAKYSVDISIRALRYYRQHFVEPKDRLPPTEVLKELEKRAKKVDLCVERVKMIDAQWDRIESEMKLEKNIGKTFQNLHREFVVRNQILSDLKQDYIDLGLIEKIPERIELKNDISQAFWAAAQKFKKLKENDKPGDTPVTQPG